MIGGAFGGERTWQGKGTIGNPVPVSDLAAAILDPVLRKRAGISIGLVQSWEEIAGPRLAAHRGRKRSMAAPHAATTIRFEPAVLIIACEGFAALHVQHETGEIIGRVNAFLGFEAIGRIRIVQKPVRSCRASRSRAPRPLSPAKRRGSPSTVRQIEDEGLRASLERLGATIVGTTQAESR